MNSVKKLLMHHNSFDTATLPNQNFNQTQSFNHEHQRASITNSCPPPISGRRPSRAVDNASFNCSQQSILSTMDRFVKAVNNMDATVLIPSRLKDMDLRQRKTSTSSIQQLNNITPVQPPAILQHGDLYSFYLMLHDVKKELLWGSSSSMSQFGGYTTSNSNSNLNNLNNSNSCIIGSGDFRGSQSSLHSCLSGTTTPTSASFTPTHHANYSTNSSASNLHNNNNNNHCNSSSSNNNNNASSNNNSKTASLNGVCTAVTSNHRRQNSYGGCSSMSANCINNNSTNNTNNNNSTCMSSNSSGNINSRYLGRNTSKTSTSEQQPQHHQQNQQQQNHCPTHSRQPSDDSLRSLGSTASTFEDSEDCTDSMDADSVSTAEQQLTANNEQSAAEQQQQMQNHLAAAFKQHLQGLHAILNQLADAADYFCHRYQEEVEAIVD